MSAPTSEAYRSSGFFAIRTPLLPFAAWTDWADEMPASDASADSSGSQNSVVLRERLRERLRDPVFLDALFVASPSLVWSLKDWLERPESQKGRRIERALVKYFARMTGRCTPFGLFAGCSTGRIASETRLQLAPRSAYTRHTRPDSEFLTTLVDALNHEPTLRSELHFRPNSSLYCIGDRIHYAEARVQSGVRNYFLVSATADPPLLLTIERARAGASVHELAASLLDGDVEYDEAAEYVTQLISGQVLVPELAPVVTGPAALDDLLHQLSDKPSVSNVYRQLRQLRTALQDLDASGLGVAPTRYREIADSCHGLPMDIDIARLFQVELMKPISCMELGGGVIEDLLTGVQVLYDLFGATFDNLDAFRKEFRQRYEDAEVPLAEVLDEESGIGFGASTGTEAGAYQLLDGVVFPPRAAEQTAPVNATTELLQRRLYETLAAGLDEMVLDAGDLEPFHGRDVAPLPDAFEIAGAVLPPASDNQDPRHRVLISSMGGPSGARYLGRFCHLDAQLRTNVEQHLADEEALRPAVTFVEVVHLPQGRIGNVIMRPVLRGFELAFLGRSGASADRQLSVADLTVSLRDNQIVLRSRCLNREVIPRLTCAHNTRHSSLAVYRFLGALQSQGLTSFLAWNWGALLHLPFLPRVRYGRTVLARRTWNTLGGEIAGSLKANAPNRFRQVQDWRRARGLPRHVGLVQGDNVLPVDLDNIASVDALVNLVAGRPQFVVREMLPGPGELVVEGPEGAYCHEIIVPFVRKTDASQNDLLANRPPMGSVALADGRPPPDHDSPEDGRRARIRPLGSDWLYLKIFCGQATADRVLCEVLSPLIEQFLKSELVKRWFFIRHGDPAWHLRIRFQGLPTTLTHRVLPDVTAALRQFVESGLIWSLQIDTYNREIDRYGGPPAMDLCEELFHADSDAVQALLCSLRADEGVGDRWHLTLVGMDRLLEDFGFDLAQKAALMQSCARDSAREFGLAGEHMARVLMKYRSDRRTVQNVLEGRAWEAKPAISPDKTLMRRSERVRPLASRLSRLRDDEKLRAPLDGVVAGLVHLHANRMLRGSTRAQETILYQYLDRCYDSELARLRRSRSQHV